MKILNIKVTTEILQKLLNAVANHYNYITAKPIIDDIEKQLNKQLEELENGNNTNS